MWRIIKKAKELWDWISLGWQVVGLAGQTAFVSTFVATIVVTIAAVLKQLPWPLVVAAVWAMVVGVANVVTLFITLAALRELRSAQRAPTQTARLIVHPFYEAWRHVERFTVEDAAFLWADIEPRGGRSTPEVGAWIEALCAAIRKGELAFVPVEGSIPFSLRPVREKEREIKAQQASADRSTMVRRVSLAAFAEAKGHRPKFLFG